MIITTKHQQVELAEIEQRRWESPPNIFVATCDQRSSGNILSNVSVSYTSTQYKNTGGYVSGSCDCKCVADKIMKQILGNNANIGSNGTKMQLWKEVNGVLTKVGNVNDVFNTINTLLLRWRKEFETFSDASFQGKGVSRLSIEQAEIQRLNKLLEIRRKENEILKKAIGIISESDR